jgi:glycosyltransferase involved in cell wall biosynthesis
LDEPARAAGVGLVAEAYKRSTVRSELDSSLLAAAGAAASVGTRRGHLASALPLPVDAPEISVVVPVYDEVECVRDLYRSTVATLSRFGRRYEIVVVDDGSTDGTYEAFAELAAADPRLRLIRFGRNFGQTAAMAAGIDHARGAVIVPMDGDLQNDPEDIPVLVAKLDEGYDVVSGWRENRQDRALTRKIPSRLANWLIGRVTGVRLHDYGCTLKAYRAEIIKQTRLYGEMHRFVPALAYMMGARIAEVPVRHHARRFGRSKYGIGRTFKVMLDLLTLKFLSAYGTKPIHIFGGAGLTLCFGGIGAGAYTLYEKWVNGIYVHRNPVILLAVFLFLLGFSFILLGLIAELIVRTYHESQAKPIYWIRESRNLDGDSASA